jgi:hypothetical protein
MPSSVMYETDDSLRIVAAVTQQAEADEVEQRAIERVGQKHTCGHRQDEGSGPACGFEHRNDGDRSQRDIDGVGIGGSVDKILEVDDGPCERHAGDGDERPVHTSHTGAVLGG